MNESWRLSSNPPRPPAKRTETTMAAANRASIETSSTSDLWRDPAWQPFGIIVGAILAVVAIIISLQQWQRKSLAYEALSNEHIVRVSDDSIGSELQISYQGKAIKDLYLVTIRLFNSGNAEIRPEDYVKHLIINFGERAEILGMKIIEQSPNNLGVDIDHGSTKGVMHISPILLNRNDYFIIQALVSSFSRVDPSGRIAGVSRIREVTPSRLDTQTIAAFGMLSGLIASFLATILPVQAKLLGIEISRTFIVVALGLLAGLCSGFIDTLIPRYRTKKK